jgi:transcriptional regulator with XRE-family HTH domain
LIKTESIPYPAPKGVKRRQQIVAQRESIAALKLDIAKLQKALKAVGRAKPPALPVHANGNDPASTVRFSAGGLLKLRKRLGLSRAAFAPLLGVSGLAIARWESGANRPRQPSIEKLAIVRKLSKRQVDQLLAQHTPKAKATPKEDNRSTAARRAKKIASAGKKRANKKRPAKRTGKASASE